MISSQMCVSAVLALVFVVACDDDTTDADSGVDAASDSSISDTVLGDGPTDAGPADATSLEGTFACGSRTCESGQICVLHPSGVDAGIASTPDCEDPPAECGDVLDCGGADQPNCCDLPCPAAICPEFIRDECSTRNIEGRNVECLWG